MLVNDSSPSFRLRLPHARWFTPRPNLDQPLTVPAPYGTRDFAAPFGVSEAFYQAALDWKVPVTIASVYAVTVVLINAYNKSNGNRPWPISKYRLFTAFVLVHNISLAVFSGLTCFGMLRALAHSWPGVAETYLFGKFWPSFLPENGLAGAADALCHMHGPRGFGDAVYYDTASAAWKSKNTIINLLESRPDPTDVGRLWNEGLAFWGFWFYMSKFYEVVDTFIIVAKGKRSSTLQTYHHAGAMLSMWSGIRFMSPPIWMFVFLNSGVHTVMYTYYTLTALRIRVPKTIKQLITTLQISQFLIGITFASLHLFVEYTVPVTTAYTVTHTITSMIQEATASASSMASEASESIVASIGIGQLLKKIALRAAGEEGLAENIRNKQGQQFQAHQPVLDKIVPKFREHMNRETKYKTLYETMDCIETENQAFAILLNIFYLFPLTFLFARFFVRSYLRRGKIHDTPSPQRRFSNSLDEAAEDVRRELKSEQPTDVHDREVSTEAKDQLKQQSNPETVDTPSKKKKKNKSKSHANSTDNSVNNLKDSADDLLKQGKEQLQKAKDAVTGENHSSSASPSSSSTKDTKNTSNDGTSRVEKVKEGVQETVQEGKSLVDDVKDKAEDLTADVKKEASSTESKMKREVDPRDSTAKTESGSPSNKASKDKLDESAVIVEATKIEPLVPEGQAPAGGVKEKDDSASPSKSVNNNNNNNSNSNNTNNNGNQSKNSTPSKKRR